MAAAHLFGLGDAQMQMQPQQPQPPAAAAAPAPKKKRNQPDPDAEVIALSPKTLLATNRFVCEVCNKGFQREQNLQLHRRGHNLPWKLKQKNPKETRRRVYLCPEPTALGDLTGIKKHYSRKHGEKKWKCDKCNKRYAVQSDWKAHSKTCGTREYRCDCGTLFSSKPPAFCTPTLLPSLYLSILFMAVVVVFVVSSPSSSLAALLRPGRTDRCQRDSFITHRAFCDALAQESARVPPIAAGMYGSGGMALGLSGGMAASHMQSFQNQAHSSAITGNNPAGNQFDHLMPSSVGSPSFRGGAQPASSSSSPFYLAGADDGQPGHSSLLHGKPAFHGLMQLPEQHAGQPAGSNGLLNLGFFSGAGQDARLVFPEHVNGSANTESAAIFSGNLMGNQMATAGGGFSSSLYSSTTATVAPPQMSATALLQKAAQMGATTSGGGGGGGGSSVNSLLRGLGSGGAMNGRPGGGAGGFMAAGGESSSSRSTPSQAENESQFRDLMNSLAASGSSGAGGASAFGGAFAGMDDGKLSTRDFLGVGGGGVVRGIGGAAGMPMRHDGASGIGMGSLDPAEMK
ncbi:hypothetical protein HU200_062103 [Digitaria exilis]|uniref:C2H2-type domain-containing protein n=1 Tax=Digitaria exilis TaxID=1010633 RepID=A0A835DW89_9POAL|nr:hypothetical protein HU200_062103 [Digitaria exilis]